MSLTGEPDGPPYRAGISVFDVMAGNHALIGILAALHHRDATGEGQLVEINLLSSALTGLVNHSSAHVAGGVVPTRMGNAHPSVFPYESLPTGDDDLIVTAANDRQFRALCEVLGKQLPLNGAGVCGAALADLGLPIELLRGFALLARTAGLVGQLAEEMRSPVARDVFLSVDLNNRPVEPSPYTPDDLS